jgi:hypothetical protein
MTGKYVRSHPRGNLSRRPLPLTDRLPSVRSRQSVHAVAWSSIRNVLEPQDVQLHPSPAMPSLPAVHRFRNDDQITLGSETRFG